MNEINKSRLSAELYGVEVNEETQDVFVKFRVIDSKYKKYIQRILSNPNNKSVIRGKYLYIELDAGE